MSCLRCPRNRPAGNVVITEHWLTRCVQAEKGLHLLRDHRPVRLHILVVHLSKVHARGQGAKVGRATSPNQDLLRLPFCI